MKWVKRIIGLLLLICAGVLLHYYLPSKDVVQIVGTDVKRMDISKGSPFWDRPDAGTDDRTTRDVRFISTVRANGKPRVYRNEDTGWSFPFYLKFDSSDLSAKAQDIAKEDEVWVAVSHYGWRIRLFSIFPNAYKIKRVSGPNAVLIPWFNIVFLFLLACLVFFIWRMIRRWSIKNIDPIADKIGEEISDVTDSLSTHTEEMQKNAAKKHSAFRQFMRRWFGSA